MLKSWSWWNRYTADVAAHNILNNPYIANMNHLIADLQGLKQKKKYLTENISSAKPSLRAVIFLVISSACPPHLKNNNS